jgi:hypothetical protein
VRAFVEAIETGINAAHDYRRLSGQVSPQDASRIVFEKHFSK